MYRIVGSVVNFEILDPKWAYFLNFTYDEEIGEIQSEMGEEAYLTENLIQNEYQTFNPILNIGGLFIILIYSCVLYLIYPIVKCCLKKSDKRKPSS